MLPRESSWKKPTHPITPFELKTAVALVGWTIAASTRREKASSRAMRLTASNEDVGPVFSRNISLIVEIAFNRLCLN